MKISLRLLGATLCLVLLVTGCAQPVPMAVSDLHDHPAEQALLDGLRAYEDGQYETAEAHLRRALELGLAAPRDQANANKTLAFILCTSDRVVACEQAFKAARKADPLFSLSRAERGHPLWGPIYKKALGLAN
jgi:Flp pilus assembly protein TadD